MLEDVGARPSGTVAGGDGDGNGGCELFSRFDEEDGGRGEEGEAAAGEEQAAGQPIATGLPCRDSVIAWAC